MTGWLTFGRLWYVTEFERVRVERAWGMVYPESIAVSYPEVTIKIVP
jgi:hypothetical protein